MHPWARKFRKSLQMATDISYDGLFLILGFQKPQVNSVAMPRKAKEAVGSIARAALTTEGRIEV